MHDYELPHATYPATCVRCGRSSLRMYCNRCCDELLQQDLNDVRILEVERANYLHKKAVEREEKRSRYPFYD